MPDKNAVQGGQLRMRVNMAPEEAPQAAPAPIAPAEPDAQPEVLLEPEQVPLRSAGPDHPQPVQDEPEAPPAPETPAPAKPRRARKPEITPERQQELQELADYRALIALGNEHEGIKREVARARKAKGLPVNEHLAKYLEDATPAETAAITATTPVDPRQDPKVDAEYTRLLQLPMDQGGGLKAATLYLAKQTMQEAMARVAEMEGRFKSEDARRNENNKTALAAVEAENHREAMVKLATVNTHFFELDKDDAGKPVAVWRDSDDAKTLHGKMVEIAKSNRVGEGTSEKDLMTMALIDLGWYGQYTALMKGRTSTAPAAVQATDDENAPPPPLPPASVRQAPAQIAPRAGQTVVSKGKMSFFVPVRG